MVEENQRVGDSRRVDGRILGVGHGHDVGRDRRHRLARAARGDCGGTRELCSDPDHKYLDAGSGPPCSGDGARHADPRRRDAL